MICIPAFNEEKVIGDLVKRAKRYGEVVVCDDGSSDSTSKEAKKVGAQVIVHDKNKGKGAALKSLFGYARKSGADIIVTIDGDGQFLPEEIDNVVKPILEQKSDIVIGYRYDDKSEMPSYRKLGNKLLDKMTNLASELPFRDTQSGFRAYSRKAIQQIEFTSDGFGADSEILINASKKQLKISEVKVTVLYNIGTDTSTKNPVSHTGDIIASLVELIALRHPLKYLGVPGLSLTIIGIIYGISAISYFNQTRIFSVPTTLIALGATIIGTILVLMAVVLFSIVRTSKRGI